MTYEDNMRNMFFNIGSLTSVKAKDAIRRQAGTQIVHSVYSKLLKLL